MPLQFSKKQPHVVCGDLQHHLYIELKNVMTLTKWVYRYSLYTTKHGGRASSMNHMNRIIMFMWSTVHVVHYYTVHVVHDTGGPRFMWYSMSSLYWCKSTKNYPRSYRGSWHRGGLCGTQVGWMTTVTLHTFIGWTGLLAGEIRLWLFVVLVMCIPWSTRWLNNKIT